MVIFDHIRQKLTYPRAFFILQCMSQSPRQKLLNALFVFLQPVAKALLKSGISHAEFEEVSKAAFVKVALNDYGVRGRKTNMSRVAVMTGLSRKETRRLSKWDPESSDFYDNVNSPLVHLLHLWHTNPAYVDVDGRPLAIPYSGVAPSFVDLVKRVGGDLPAGAIKTELIRVGVIDADDEDSITVEERTILSASADERITEAFVCMLTRHAQTMAYNASPENTGQTRSDMVVESEIVDPKQLSRFRRMTRKRLWSFVKDFDDYLSEYEYSSDEAASAEDKKTAGVGIFYFEEP